MHKSSAKQRDIEFKLTFEQWRDIWGDNIVLRGVKRGCLVMCRVNDAGAYEVGNVYLGTPARNGASRRMARENREGANSRLAHANIFWRGDRESDADLSDSELIERELGIKTSGVWA